jgi:hypothetical protein
MRPMTMRTVSVAALLFAATATYAHADSQNSVPMPRETWPATVVYDVSLSNCDKMGGQLGVKASRQFCYIPRVVKVMPALRW